MVEVIISCDLVISFLFQLCTLMVIIVWVALTTMMPYTVTIGTVLSSDVL